MFTNFNHKFVYRYPLLWNTKIIPFLLISLLIHAVFFVLGYQNAIVASVQIHSYTNQESNAVTLNLFAILISVIAFIIWCVLYFKNNAIKAFYPKTGFALFKEWALIVVFGLLNFSYVLSAILGANVQIRNSMPEKLALERCQTISKASMFLSGSYKELAWTDSLVGQETIRVERDSFSFEGKKYALNSLINKNINSFAFFDTKQDSLARLQVQRWMKENNKAAIAELFTKYMEISNEHQLKCNITAQQWLQLTYDYPNFTKYANIGRAERQLTYNNEYGIDFTSDDADIVAPDTLNTDIIYVDGKSYIYSKYYVSYDVLEKYYQNIANAYQNPLVEHGLLLVVLYISFGISLLVFSFRVTAAKPWLIALIALGVTQIIFAILAVIISYDLVYPYIFIGYCIAIGGYFAIVYTQKRGKKWSAITLNQILWLLPSFLPMVYVVVLQTAKQLSGYNERYDLKINQPVETFPKIEWLENNALLLFLLNLVVVTLVLVLLSGLIKKWRGIPEE